MSTGDGRKWIGLHKSTRESHVGTNKDVQVAILLLHF